MRDEFGLRLVEISQFLTDEGDGLTIQQSTEVIEGQQSYMRGPNFSWIRHRLWFPFWGTDSAELPEARGLLENRPQTHMAPTGDCTGSIGTLHTDSFDTYKLITRFPSLLYLPLQS